MSSEGPSAAVAGSTRHDQGQQGQEARNRIIYGAFTIGLAVGLSFHWDFYMGCGAAVAVAFLLPGLVRGQTAFDRTLPHRALHRQQQMAALHVPRVVVSKAVKRTKKRNKSASVGSMASVAVEEGAIRGADRGAGGNAHAGSPLVPAPSGESTTAETSKGPAKSPTRSPAKIEDPTLLTRASAVEKLKQEAALPRQRSEGAMENSPPPIFPFTIRNLTSTLDSQIIIPNSRVPVKVETKGFVGQLFFKVSNKPPDPHFAPYFEGKRRMWEIMVQGHVKGGSNGKIIMVGAEVPREMKLGFIHRQIAKICMGMIPRLVKYAHTSLGNDKIDECPHCVFPVLSNADRIALTKPSEAPEIGVPMFSEEYDKKKQNFAPDLAVSEDTMISLSLHVMYIDLAGWKLCNIPGSSRAIDMHGILKEMPLSIVAYNVEKDYKGPHIPSTKDYLFKLEISHAGPEVQTRFPTPNQWVSHATSLGLDMRMRYQRDNESEEKAGGQRQPGGASVVAATEAAVAQGEVVASATRDSRLSEDDTDTSVDDHHQPPVDEEHFLSMSPVVRHAMHKAGRKLHIIGWIDRDAKVGDVLFYVEGKIGNMSKAMLWSNDQLVELEKLVDLHLGDDMSHIVRPSSLQVQLKLVNKRRKLGNIEGESVETATRRGTSIEQYRVAVAFFIYATLNASTIEDSQLQALCHDSPESDSLLRSRTLKEFGASCNKQSLAFEGPLLWARWETHWVETWCVLEEWTLAFFVRNGHGRAHLTQMTDVLGVSKSESMLGDKFFGLEIETSGQIIYLVARTENSRDLWVEHVRQHVQKTKARHVDDPERYVDPREVYISRINRWGIPGRLLLNSRKLFVKPLVSMRPTDLVESLLQNIVVLCNERAEQNANALHAFLDVCSSLKGIDLSEAALTRREKLCFVFNLYHLVMFHGLAVREDVVVKGQHMREWYAHLNAISYEVSDLIYSCMEIEYCLIRNKAESRPHIYSNRFRLPKKIGSRSPRSILCLDEYNPIFNLILNFGTHSCLEKVPIFSPTTFDAQIKNVAMEVLDQELVIDLSRRTVILPKMCEWYRHDFSKKGSRADTFDLLKHYMSPDKLEAARKLDSHKIIFKYKSFDWRLRDKFKPSQFL